MTRYDTLRHNTPRYDTLAMIRYAGQRYDTLSHASQSLGIWMTFFDLAGQGIDRRTNSMVDMTKWRQERGGGGVGGAGAFRVVVLLGGGGDGASSNGGVVVVLVG